MQLNTASAALLPAPLSPAVGAAEPFWLSCLLQMLMLLVPVCTLHTPAPKLELSLPLPRAFLRQLRAYLSAWGKLH